MNLIAFVRLLSTIINHEHIVSLINYNQIGRGSLMSFQDRISLIHCVPRELVSIDSTPPSNKPKHPPY